MSDRQTISIRVNERAHEVPLGTRVQSVRYRLKPSADIAIVNGYPSSDDCELSDGDAVVLIRRGEIPSREELEHLLVARHSPGVWEKCRKARVGIAGCGGLGSHVANALTRLGIGKLVLVDYDVVEPSNLNRQLYFVDQLGRLKVEALAENLHRANPYVGLQSIAARIDLTNVEDLFGGCDVVAECLDEPAAKRNLLVGLRRCGRRIPYVGASGLAGYGDSQDLVVREVMRDTYVVGDGESEAKPGEGLMMPRVLVTAGHQANVVLRMILGQPPVLVHGSAFNREMR